MTSSNSVRLQKYIAMSGYCSRRKAEEIINQGLVSVNGVTILEQGVQVFSTDEVRIDNKLLTLEESHVYYVINKPREVLSSVTDDRGRVCVTDLIPETNRLFPVGRLDYETTGALILTNDGEFANLLTHPRYDMPKKYRVDVTGRLTPRVIQELKGGVTIEDVIYQGVDIFSVRYDAKKERTQFSITLHEGKNRQIRRMFKHYGLPVKKLHRYAIGPLLIDDLTHGQYRPLNSSEVKRLMTIAKGEA